MTGAHGDARAKGREWANQATNSVGPGSSSIGRRGLRHRRMRRHKRLRLLLQHREQRRERARTNNSAMRGVCRMPPESEAAKPGSERN